MQPKVKEAFARWLELSPVERLELALIQEGYLMGSPDAQPVKRPRGRPPGSRTRVVQPIETPAAGAATVPSVRSSRGSTDVEPTETPAAGAAT